MGNKKTADMTGACSVLGVDIADWHVQCNTSGVNYPEVTSMSIVSSRALSILISGDDSECMKQLREYLESMYFA